MKYVILSPPYRNSSCGIRVLYELQKMLIRAGRDAIVVNHLCNIEDDDIAVYPEGVHGNPLNAKTVIRYVLNTPSHDYDKNEITVAYSMELARYSNGRILDIPLYESFFRNEGRERDINCVYVGKGAYQPHPDVDSAYEITSEAPKTRKELAWLLNRCRTFYTYDNLTALSMEAWLCGCECVLVKDGALIPFVPKHKRVNYMVGGQLYELIKLAERG